MNTPRPSKDRSPKGKEPAGRNIIDLSESPSKNTSSKQKTVDTNMGNKSTCAGANMTPLGTGSEASSSKAGTVTNPFSPSSLSIDPRPNRGWRPPQLPVFSSNDFEPQGETRRGTSNNGNSSNQSNSTAPQTPQDPARRFTVTQKCKVLETCLSIKEEYLSLPPASHHDQEAFWTKVLNEKLSRDLVSNFKGWKQVKESIEQWCYTRRTLLREGNLPPVSPAQPELDTLVDRWNTVFVTRFCQVHRGYFEKGLWAIIENRVSWMVSEHVDKSITSMLQTRRDELESSVGRRLLSHNNSLTEYDNAVKSVQDGFTESQRSHTQAMESEAVLSIVRELRPVLENAFSQHFNSARQTRREPSSGHHTGPTIPTEPTAMRNGPRGHSTSASSMPQHPMSCAVPSPMVSGNKRPLPDSKTDRESGRVWKEGAHRMVLHELGSRTETEKETADTSKDNFRHQEGLRCHELQEGHLRPRLMNDRTGPGVTCVGTRNTQTAGTVMTDLTAVAHREGSGKILSSLMKCRLDGRTN
ncbi:uncharacterized protein FMAN_02109 [Fusarium mangiferae]|uniref:Uncharacterized protein n=1 Tax=Fusarium mangiferae TaxID=192010 RepID=A0A1L7TKL2_FUSMA|nr:uncharacterized protein FMAN_02109 [Fusarium mangiferae]CVK99218.1 uncharacterized protein FMAN_02109 [Fusarium mangiferae]